jgi:curli biogenesis system outer membrane secretion channel CsgG
MNRVKPGHLLSSFALVAVLAPLWARADDGSKVERCSHKFGTITVVDPRSGLGQLQNYGLGSPTALIRMMIQQSGCFDVVERGVAMANMQQERALMQAGDARDDSNIGKGQMQVADFVMTPDVQIPTSTTGGIGGALSSFGGIGRVLGGIAGGLKFKEADTSLMIADVRSSIQVAAAEGKGTKTDFNIGGWSVGAGLAGSAGGFASSPEGKVVAASLLDNYNKIVFDIRDRVALIQPTTAESSANAAVSTQAHAPQQAGQMLTPKIANVKAYAGPSRDTPVVATLQRGDELVANGEVKDGFVQVDASNFSGWVQRTLVAPLSGAPAVQAAVTPMPVPAAAAPLVIPGPHYRYGSFSGTMNGADQGSFRVLIDDKGVASGDGNLNRIGAFGLYGQYDAEKGQVVLQGGSSAGSLILIGRYDPDRGSIVGSWNTGGLQAMIGYGGQGGSFSAQRQQ